MGEMILFTYLGHSLVIGLMDSGLTWVFGIPKYEIRRDQND